jgi:toxin YoeB
MKLVFTELGWEDYLWFQDNDRQLLKRINLLIRDALHSPDSGVGKPERLRGNLSGQWSRRSTKSTVWYTLAPRRS